MTRVAQMVAVVPVFVNAGAALFPALVAGAASLLGLLLRPRALWAACRARPGRAAGAVVGMILVTGAIWGVLAMREAKGGPAAGAGGTDWVELGKELVRARSSPHAVLLPLWHHGLDGEMALATPAAYRDASGKVTVYVPAMVYTVERQAGTFWAFDGESGAVQWKGTRMTGVNGEPGDLLRPIFSCPLVVAGGTRVVTGQGLHDSANCPLVCFDVEASRQARAGRVDWTVPTTLHLESSPARVMVGGPGGAGGGEECVVIGAGAIEGPDRKPVGDPGYLLCVAVGSGKTVWQFPLNDPEAATAVDEAGVVYAGAGLNGNAVVALRSGAGVEKREIWRVTTKYPATGDLLVTDAGGRKLVLLGTGNGDFVNADPNPAGSVLALDAGSGAVAWETALPDGVLGRLGVMGSGSGARVLAACRDGNAYALELGSGGIVWRRQVSEQGRVPVLSGMASMGEYVFALSADGTLAVLGGADGALLERRRLVDPAQFSQNLTMAAPVVLGDRLYVSTETAGVWAFRVGW